jgi:hypothetical protein
MRLIFVFVTGAHCVRAEDALEGVGRCNMKFPSHQHVYE